MRTNGDFYEDDEPTEAVIAAFERGTDSVTADPHMWGTTAYLGIGAAQTRGAGLPKLTSSVPARSPGNLILADLG